MNKEFFPKSRVQYPCKFHARKGKKLLQRYPLHIVSHSLAQTDLQHAGWPGPPCLLMF